MNVEEKFWKLAEGGWFKYFRGNYKKKVLGSDRSFVLLAIDVCLHHVVFHGAAIFT